MIAPRPSDEPARAPRPASSTLSVTYHLTHNCNLRCSYCYTGAKFGRGMTDATADRAVDFAIAEAERAGVQHLETVFFGGEPLLRLDLIERIHDRLVARAPDLELSFKLSTNGTLLTEETVASLVGRNVYLSVSIDGDPEVHDAQRPDAHGRPTSARIAEGLRTLLSFNPFANVHCVIAPGTADRVDRSLAWIAEQGVRYISSALDHSAHWERPQLDALEKSYARLARWYVERTRAGDRFFLSCFDERIRTRVRGPLDPSERCQIGIRQFSISPSGALYPCVQFVREDDDPEFRIGSIETGFTEARHSICSTSEAPRAECSGCSLTDRCSSWCACTNWSSTGALDRASPVVCEHERILFPIADRVAEKLYRRRTPEFIHKHYNPAYTVLRFAEDIVIREVAHSPEGAAAPRTEVPDARTP